MVKDTLVIRLFLSLVLVSVLSACEKTAESSTGWPTDDQGARVQFVDGEGLYRERCSGCHGAEGRGDGPAAEYLTPRPRDFTRGLFKMATTLPGHLPTDDDLARVIRERIYWSAMHPYGEFTEGEIAALVLHVKKLSRYWDETRKVWVNHFEMAGAPETIDVPSAPPKSPGVLELGRRAFQANCAACHGPGGEGDGASAPTLKDDRQDPISPRNLTVPIYKGGANAPDIFVRISRGIPGTPMPSFDSLSEQERWALSYFVVSLQSWPEDIVTQGSILFQAYGCYACHGLEGQGGVRDPNYVKETVPALNTLAERLFLFDEADTKAFIDLLRSGEDPDSLDPPPDIPRWPAVLAQYNSIQSVIKEGRRAGKAVSSGPEPPLNMPIWGHLLREEDVRALVAYLLTLEQES